MTDTKTRILDAAERLFGSHGYEATSIRAITRDAGVNVASVHYHFGSKEVVLRGVLDRVAGPITQERDRLLDSLAAPSVEDIIEAFIRPDFEAMLMLQDRDHVAARLIGRIYSDPSEPVVSIALEQFTPTTARFVAALRSALPEVSEEAIWWRIVQMVAVIVATFARYPEEGMSRDDVERTIARLVAFLAPAMRSVEPKGVAAEPG